MTIRTVLLAGAWLAMIAAGSGAAEFPTDRVYAFFSASPTLDARVKPAPGEAGYTQILRLRPNTEQSAYVYVYNPKDDDATVTVVLSSSYNAGSEIARTPQAVLVPSKQVVKIALAGRAAPSAPVAAPKDAKDPPPTGVRLKDQDKLYLRVEEKTDKPGKVEDRKYEEFQLIVPNPVSGSAFKVERIPSKEGSFTVKVKFAKQTDNPLFTDKPAKVRLDLRTDYNTSIDPNSVGEGTFEAEVPVDGEATLYAEGVKFKESSAKPAIVFVSVDGYDRAFASETDFKSSNTEYKTPFLNVRLSTLAQVPGKPAIVTVEADDDTNDTVLAIDRVGNQTFETIKNFGKQSRQKAVYVSAGGEGDAVKLHPVVKDWSIEFATASVAGVRTFQVRNGNAPPAVRSLIVDRSAPAKVALVLPAKDKLLVGTEQILKATGEDAESDIAAVYFHLGDAPTADGKPAPGGKVVKGVQQADGTWLSKDPIRLPEAKGDVKVGVLVVNGVGLASSADTTAYVREPEKPKEEKEKEKPKKTTGSIEGVVLHSIRPQPDLPVTLRDPAGKELKKTTTDSSGKFEFKDLQPGEYIVSSVKRADLNSNGSQTVTVEAGDKPAKAEIAIKR
jgi:SdrD B-like domain